MKRIFATMAMTAVAAFMALSITSCGESEEPTPVPPGPGAEGNTIIVTAEANSSATFTVEAESSWTINNPILWASFDVLSGTGNTDVTVTVSSANEEMVERIGTFTVNDETYYLIQRGIKDIVLPEGTFALPGQFDELRIAVNTTFTKEDMSASTTTEWLTFTAIEATDSTLLDDGNTYSDLKTYELVFAATPNDGGEIKDGSVTLTCNGENYEIPVRQFQPIETDLTQDFYRHSVFLRFTSTNCGYCPYMETQFEQVYSDAEMHERVVPISMYGSMQGGNYIWSNTNYFMNQYGAGGYPHCAINGVASVPNYQSIQLIGQAIGDLIDEATGNMPSKTNIMASSTLEGNQVAIDLFIAAKEELDINVFAFILEDGIVGYQADYGGLLDNAQRHTHNYITRGILTSIDGNVPNKIEDGLYYIRLVGEIPSEVENADNAYIAIYTTYPGSYKGNVSLAEYTDLGFIVDNAAKLPLNGNVDFKYE